MDAPTSSDVFLFDQFFFDRRSGTLFRRADNGQALPVSLRSRALAVLSVLIQRPGDLVSKDEIMNAVWPGTVVEEANLSVQISTLRRILDAGRLEGSCIRTVSGRGYQFVAEVTRQEDGTLSAPAIALGAGDGHAAAPPPAALPTPIGGSEAIGSAARGQRAPWRAILAFVFVAGILASGLVAAAIWHRRGSGSDQAPKYPSIVVLPFANLSSDREQDYFADAITGDLTTDLSRISGSVVIAHSTAATYRETPVDVRQIGRELGVRYILEGSVRRMGEQVEVNAQLIDAGSGAHLWADRFNTDRRNLPQAQNEIVGRLARTLDLELVAAASRRIEQERQTNPDAQDLIMRGLDLWYRPFSVANRQEAQRCFERALQLDPQSVEARIGVAMILAANIGTGLSRAPEHDATRAEQLLNEAIERDPNSSRAHEVLGLLRRIQNRLNESRIELEIAVALDRNNAHALFMLGQTLMFLGQPEAAIPLMESANRLDPRDANSAFADWAVAACDLLLGRVAEATDLLRKARDKDPRIYFFQLYLAAALGLNGDLEEAKQALAAAFKLKPEVHSLAQWRATQPWITNPRHWALFEKTVNVGLRRAGMPDE